MNTKRERLPSGIDDRRAGWEGLLVAGFQIAGCKPGLLPYNFDNIAILSIAGRWTNDDPINSLHL